MKKKFSFIFILIIILSSSIAYATDNVLFQYNDFNVLAPPDYSIKQINSSEIELIKGSSSDFLIQFFTLESLGIKAEDIDYLYSINITEKDILYQLVNSTYPQVTEDKITTIKRNGHDVIFFDLVQHDILFKFAMVMSNNAIMFIVGNADIELLPEEIIKYYTKIENNSGKNKAASDGEIVLENEFLVFQDANIKIPYNLEKYNYIYLGMDDSHSALAQLNISLSVANNLLNANNAKCILYPKNGQDYSIIIRIKENERYAVLSDYIGTLSQEQFAYLDQIARELSNDGTYDIQVLNNISYFVFNTNMPYSFERRYATLLNKRMIYCYLSKTSSLTVNDYKNIEEFMQGVQLYNEQ